MTDEDWAQLKYFKKTDNWGDPDKMDRALLFQLDALRAFVGSPIHVCCGTNLQHLEDSQHYLGKAVDVIFAEKGPGDLLDLLLACSRFGFGGIGVYPSWALDGVVRGGFHLDTRDSPYGALWMGVEQDGQQVYVAMSRDNLRLHGLI